VQIPFSSQPIVTVLEAVGLGLALAAILGLAIPLLNSYIIVPPAAGAGQRSIELGTGVVIILACMFARRETPPLLAIVTSRFILGLLILAVANIGTWGERLLVPKPPVSTFSTWTGNWRGTLIFRASESQAATLVLQVDSDHPRKLEGVLTVTYANGRCVFDLNAVSFKGSAAEFTMSTPAPVQPACRSGAGHHLTIRPKADIAAAPGASSPAEISVLSATEHDATATHGIVANGDFVR
jgi:hypothetical protein